MGFQPIGVHCTLDYFLPSFSVFCFMCNFLYIHPTPFFYVLQPLSARPSPSSHPSMIPVIVLFNFLSSLILCMCPNSCNFLFMIVPTLSSLLFILSRTSAFVIFCVQFNCNILL